MSNPETPKTASDLGVSASAHVVGVLAEALAEHAFPTFDIERGCWDCPCGEPVPRSSNGWEKHVASVVAALPNIAIVEHVAPTIRGDWAPGRWWRVIAPNNIVWCETSDEREARAAIRDGDVLERLHDGPQLREWRAVAGGQA